MILSPTMREKLTTPRPKDKMTTHLPSHYADMNEALLSGRSPEEVRKDRERRRAIAMVERLQGGAQ